MQYYRYFPNFNFFSLLSHYKNILLTGRWIEESWVQRTFLMYFFSMNFQAFFTCKGLFAFWTVEILWCMKGFKWFPHFIFFAKMFVTLIGFIFSTWLMISFFVIFENFFITKLLITYFAFNTRIWPMDSFKFSEQILRLRKFPSESWM